MKSAANKGGPVPTPVLSHIPLPRRKSSSKGDKVLDLNDTDFELGGDSTATRSLAKMSLLGGTSFCCVSGQKEDYLPEAKVPPPRKRPPNSTVKQAKDPSAPSTPLVPHGKGLVKNRRGRIMENNSEDTRSQSSETGLTRQSHEDIKTRAPGDSRLRPLDQRGRNAPSSSHRKISRDPLPFHEGKKSSEITRKWRVDASPRAVASDLVGVKKSKENVTADNCPPNETDSRFKPPAAVSPQKCTNSGSPSGVGNGAFRPNGEPDDARTPGHRAYNLVNDGVRESVEGVAKISNGRISGRKEIADSELMRNSHDSDDFDCPCCDKTSTLVDGPMSDAEIHVFTSCDVVAPSSQDVEANSEGVSDKERTLQMEVDALKEDLQAERLKLKTHQESLQHLQEQLAMNRAWQASRKGMAL